MSASPAEVARAAREAGRKVPDFFIVGHPKSGTTALWEMLRSHPQVFMPELKETLFFDRELHFGLRPGDPQPDTLEEYLELFAPARPDQRAGEASPSYLRSRFAAGRIAEIQPDARIVAILREPADFLRSMHLELLKDHVETEKDLRRAIERERREPERKPVLSYSDERVEYAAQLRRYHEALSEEQVLVLIYDDFRADNEGTLRRVLRHLGVDEHAPVAPSEANRTVIVRSPRTYELMRSVYLGRGPAGKVLSPMIKAVTSQRMRREGLDAFRRRIVYGRPPAPDEQLMLELRRRFEPYVVELSEYLGRDLVALWGYDQLG